MFLTKFTTLANGSHGFKHLRSQFGAKRILANRMGVHVPQRTIWRANKASLSSAYETRKEWATARTPERSRIRSLSSAADERQIGVTEFLPSSSLPSEPQAYMPPTTGLLSYLPNSVVPYAELIRFDKPTGTYYLFFPCLFSTLLAAPLCTPIPPGSTILGTSLLFLSGALVMRGAGCTINDLWDRNLDPQVSRTRFRPIARGAISPQAAIVFTGAQLLTGLAVLLQFPTQCLYYGVPSLLLVSTYPLAKRMTYYPQVVLGFTFSWGAIMGFPALGIDLLSNSTALTAAGLLYGSCISWTILYDMIYAHMDIKDDINAGIKSIALAHETNTKAVLTGLAAIQVGLLAAAGMAVGASPVFFAGCCGSAALSLGLMIWRVNLKSVADCWWWFKNGCLITGGGISLGLLGEYVIQSVEVDDVEEHKKTFV